LLWGVGAGVAVLGVITAVTVLGGPDDQPVAGVSEEPTATATATPEPTQSPTAAPTATATAEPTPSESQEPSEEPSEPSESPSPTEAPAREADQEDVDRFVAAKGPADEVAVGDVTGDGIDEVVLARIRDHSTFIVVGFWNGSAYGRAYKDQGGSGGRLESLQITDYNGVAGGEIVTEQASGEAGSSISVWGRDGDRVTRQAAKGGCWDGSHTYGVEGASIEQGEITATCHTSPLPGQVTPRDVYEWRGTRWTYARTTTPGG
jgi:hypothetical protein